LSDLVLWLDQLPVRPQEGRRQNASLGEMIESEQARRFRAGRLATTAVAFQHFIAQSGRVERIQDRLATLM
jgi:hypothetical protein